jgi:hypothetical protein
MTNIDSLLQASPTAIIAELEALRAEREVVARKETLLEQLIEIMFQRGDEAADELAAYRTSVAVGPLRYQIRQVLLAGAQNENWLPKQVHDELIVRGNKTVTLDNTRVSMKRMAERGELERPDPDSPLVFRLPVSARSGATE